MKDKLDVIILELEKNGEIVVSPKTEYEFPVLDKGQRWEVAVKKINVTA